METGTIPLLQDVVDLQAVEHAAECLRDGGVAAFPTETSYGLGASIHNLQALERIYEIKKRPAEKPLLIIIDTPARLSALASEIPPAGRMFMQKFWPGPLTILFPAVPDLPWPLHCGTGKVGIRISSNPWAMALAARLGHPVTATSANMAGCNPAVTADEVREQLVSPSPDIILDQEISAPGTCSTIVDVSRIDNKQIDYNQRDAARVFRLVRQGVIMLDDA